VKKLKPNTIESHVSSVSSTDMFEAPGTPECNIIVNDGGDEVGMNTEGTCCM